MSQRLEQFFTYLKGHEFKFSVQKVLDETGMNRNIFYKVMAELRRTYDLKRDGEIYIVTKKEGKSMSEKKLPNFLAKVLDLVKSKGEAGIAAAETGRSISGFRACISMLRSEGYRIDFKEGYYYFKGTGDYSLFYMKGEAVPRKVWGKKVLLQKSKERYRGGQKTKVFVEQVEQKAQVAPVGAPFVINYEVLNHSLKEAPKKYASFVREVVKKVQAANNAYAAVHCAQIQITNMDGIIQKAKG